MPTFEPEDVIPLVNITFPKGFGNMKNASKVISNIGWILLNYSILTTLPDSTNEFDSSRRRQSGQ
jgi:hypothetical protein